MTIQQVPYYMTEDYQNWVQFETWFIIKHLDVETSVCLSCDTVFLSVDNYFANVIFRHSGNVAHATAIVGMTDEEYDSYMLATYGPYTGVSGADMCDSLPEF